MSYLPTDIANRVTKKSVSRDYISLVVIINFINETLHRSTFGYISVVDIDLAY